MHVHGIGAMRVQTLKVFVTSDVSTMPILTLTGDCTDSIKMEAETDIHSEQAPWPKQGDQFNAYRHIKTECKPSNAEDRVTVKCSDIFNEPGANMNDSLLCSSRNGNFIDETCVPGSIHARIRFQHYRVLQSFNLSDWDVYDSLPRYYAKANILTHFELARKRAIKAAAYEESSFVAPTGSYVRVVLEGAASAEMVSTAAQQLSDSAVAPVFSLLKHENQLSVAHFLVRRVTMDILGNHNSISDKPPASKEIFLIRCGHRHWLTRPIFSQHSLNTDKHKFERFICCGQHYVASVLGPITFAPVPCFFFRPSTGELVAVGHALDCNPNRVVLKRVVLTGLPARTHKRKAVIKHMFHNPDDVRYFKPAKLTTLHGLTCHITEPVGTHGRFKVNLSRPMKQSDVVTLELYKRVFPKFVADRPDSNNMNSAKRLLLIT